MKRVAILCLAGFISSGICSAETESAEDKYSIDYSAGAFIGMPDTENLDPILTIAMEAGGEPYKGQLAVGEVIRNRARIRKKTFSEVVREKKQFSCWNSEDVARQWVAGISGDQFQKASKAWHESEWTNITEGADHYHTVFVHPLWDRSMKKTHTIGQHVFFREN